MTVDDLVLKAFRLLIASYLATFLMGMAVGLLF